MKPADAQSAALNQEYSLPDTQFLLAIGQIVRAAHTIRSGKR